MLFYLYVIPLTARFAQSVNAEWFMSDPLVHFPSLCSATGCQTHINIYVCIFTDDCRSWLLWPDSD